MVTCDFKAEIMAAFAATARGTYFCPHLPQLECPVQ